MGDTAIVGDTTVRVQMGDITKETTDAIINLSNATLDQNFGVSKFILAAAGPTVQAECAKLAKLPNKGVAVTAAGNLNCQKIIHLINVASSIITPSVKKALEACDQHNLATVSLPAIGTGAANLDAQSSIKLIMRGIEEYIIDPATTTNISEITIAVLDDTVYQEYLTFLQNYQTNYIHFTAFGKRIELIKGDITDQAVDCVLNLTNSTLDQSNGVSGAILTAAGEEVTEECKEIGTLDTDETAVTSGGNTKAKHLMHIIGPTTLSAYEPALDMVLLECHENTFQSLAIPAIGTGMAGIAPEESVNAILKSILNYLSETFIPTLETISIIVIQEPIYKAYLKVFQEKCAELQEDKGEETIAAQDLTVTISYPSTWTNPGSCGHQEVTLDKASAEFEDVAAKFLSTSGGSYEVMEIARIQDVKIWKSFSLNKQAVDQRYPGKRNVRHLYHGTSTDRIANINRGGFNRIYCGKNGTACGTGTYFAVKSRYSCQDKYSAPDSQGHKRVYQAMVITGKYCLGNKSYKEPPHINDDPDEERYDSVVDNMQKITYFVVFYDNLAYPEYLLTFKPTTP